MQVLVLPFDLAEDGIERMLERAIELVPLRRAQLLQIRMDLIARVLEHLLPRKNGLRNVIQHEPVGL